MSDQSNQFDAVDEIYTNPTPSLDFVKMQLGFWEKLVVLDAATLAASFTASGIVREHMIGDGGVGYLMAAWKLLFCGISSCLLAQSIAIPGAIAISGHYTAMRVLSLLNRSADEMLARGNRPGADYLEISSKIVSESPWLSSKAKGFSRFAGALGSLGLLASIVAFYWLYRFAQVNVSGLRH